MNQTKHLVNFKRNAISTAVIYNALLLVLILSSCNSHPKADDSKEKAETSNEAKFENTGKEKDAEFLVEAAEINLEEIKCGKFAEENASSADAKDLARMMVADHTKCLNDLKALAEKKSITIPTVLSAKGEDAYEKLINMAGMDFDKKYFSMMVDGHKGAISKFEKASTDCNDPDIRAWASETLPALHNHLEHAITCQHSCNKM
ncbi:MAG TPA: DUF4142 domain-containing protein [Bacteroidia bacterium]|nr:DUF4142 domain-containing protein [Bacteroidia bacterium]